MRAAISLLVSSLVFGSLALNCETMLSRLSFLLFADSNSQYMLTARSKPRANQPEKPAPHRGSGRRELMKFENSHLAV